MYTGRARRTIHVIVCATTFGPGTGADSAGTNQPAFTADAPSPTPRASTTTTSAPARARAYAVVSPMTPPPTTTTRMQALPVSRDAHIVRTAPSCAP